MTGHVPQAILCPTSPSTTYNSYGPTKSGALAEGGLDPEALEKAVQAYYALMGWDKETGVPTVERLYQLGIGWAAAYLPG